MSTPALPTIHLGGMPVSRLILGTNPFRGYSHMSEALDVEMRQFHTRQQIIETLLHAQQCGVTAFIARGDQVTFDYVQAYRDAGGTMTWIGQTATENPDTLGNILRMATGGAKAVYLHGTSMDNHWKAGTLEPCRDLLKVIHDCGLAAGVGSHMPCLLEHVDSAGWEADFYMASLYNISKVERQSMLAGGARVEEPFDDPDREIMARFIRSTAKPCLAFKVLGAGRKCGCPGAVRAALAFALESIKPTDAIVVGVMQKHSDQLTENVRMVQDILAASAAEGATDSPR